MEITEKKARLFLVLRLTFIIVILYISFCISFLNAKELQIYIHNKPVKSRFIEKGNEIYILATELKDLIRIDVSWDEDSGLISVCGKTLSSKIIRVGKTIYLPLKAVTKSSNFDYICNKETGIVDVYKPIRASVTETNIRNSSGEEKTTEYEKSEPQAIKSSDLLIITRTGCNFESNFSNPNCVRRGFRVFANVTNGRSTQVKNVIAKCLLTRSDGSVVTLLEVNVGNMAPGEKKEVIFYFPEVDTQQQIFEKITVKGD